MPVTPDHFAKLALKSRKRPAKALRLGRAACLITQAILFVGQIDHERSVSQEFRVLAKNGDHVGRLSRRLGLTRHEDPVKVEADLAAVLPEADRTFTSHALIWHGRRVCAARRPRCGECALAAVCPSAPV